LGYAFAMQEVLAQGIEVDWMVFATSSGGTQAGLVLGQRVFGYRGHTARDQHRRAGIRAEVTGRRPGERSKRGARPTHRLRRRGRARRRSLLRSRLRGADRPRARGDPAFARHEGILLDPVYTGRAAGGMLDLIRRGVFPSDARILFWHTGGQPALFAEPYRSELV
jgi:hypothetical protein